MLGCCLSGTLSVGNESHIEIPGPAIKAVNAFLIFAIPYGDKELDIQKRKVITSLTFVQTLEVFHVRWTVALSVSRCRRFGAHVSDAVNI